jgi:hypothetical protein
MPDRSLRELAPDFQNLRGGGTRQCRDEYSYDLFCILAMTENVDFKKLILAIGASSRRSIVTIVDK